MSEPLTDAEVAELRRVVVEHVVGRMLDERTAPYVQRLVKVLPRLLDELLLLRRRDREQVAGEEVLRQQLRDAERKIEMLRGMESLLRDAITVLGSIGEYEGMFPGADVDKKDEVARLFAAFPEWAWDGGPKLPSGS